MCPKLLAGDFAIRATHCGGVFLLAHHGYTILLSLVVCQEKCALKYELYVSYCQ
jgi:hypothetical protein